VVLKLPLKQIAALPGDTVRVPREGSYVNGKPWPGSGIPASAPTHFPYGNYLLHPNQQWVLGDNPLSYDSRYFRHDSPVVGQRDCKAFAHQGEHAMTDHERRLVLRGMSIARGLLKNTDCTHQSIVRAYQRALADAWNLNDEESPIYREEFSGL
jgi:Signal peptidase, peptidase S26